MPSITVPMPASSLILSIYLLVILHTELKPIYGEILSWRLIFAGYTLLSVETLIGLALVMNWLPVYTRFFNIGFCTIMLIKVTCHVVGFKLWAKKRHALLNPRRWGPPKTEEESQWKSSSESQEPQQ